jgi:hypothetical protein
MVVSVEAQARFAVIFLLRASRHMSIPRLAMIDTVITKPERDHCVGNPGRLTLSELKILDHSARSLSSLPIPRHAHPLQHALEVSFRSC